MITAVIFAPLFPEHSRNNTWILRKRKPEDERLFPNKPAERWASGDDWEELLND